MIKGSRILITGGTGSLGYELTRQLCEHNEVVVYSRNEERQYEMQQQFKNKAVEFRIGDVKDRYTLEMAFTGCDIGIHAAAMKDLIMCEEQPTQCYLNNVEGSRSFIKAARNSSIKKAVGVSTDKAANPSSVYGASKYIMEKLFAEADQYSKTVFCSVRFGNMIDSRGSLITIWKENPDQEIKLTHKEVCRFFFSVYDGAQTVIQALELANGGDLLIKKMKKAKILDILKIITKRENIKVMGLFPGEKIYEDLVSENELSCCFEEDDYYRIRQGQINPNPPAMFNTRNAEAFTEDELTKLIYPE